MTDWLKSRLIEVIERSGVATPAIMLNGSYLKDRGRRVYVRCTRLHDGNEHLNFFTRIYGETETGLKKTMEEDVAFNFISIIRTQLEADTLYGVSTGVPQILENSKIEMNAEHKFICIESEMYRYAKQLSEKTGNISFTMGGVLVDSQTVSVLRKAFLQQSLLDYRNVLYSDGANRFTKRVSRKNRFYSIKPESFVPVFVNVKGIHNPFYDTQLSIKTTAMYKMAENKGRFVDTGDVSAYFLTHKEICEAFGMEHFVRFKSSLWYDLFVGVLQPGNFNFPSSTRNLICWSGEMQPPTELKRCYETEKEFIEAAEKYREVYRDELNNYSKVNAMDYYVRQQFSVIRHIGPTFLDNVSLAQYCAYYNEVKLR